MIFLTDIHFFSLGATVPNHIEYQCARTRALAGNFRKRKLVQIGGLHAVSKKAARPSTLRCGCTFPWQPCAVCTGRTDPTNPRDLADSLSKGERIGLLDPGFHPAISTPEGILCILYFFLYLFTRKVKEMNKNESSL